MTSRGIPRSPRAVACLDEDTVAEELLEAAFFDAEQTAHLVGWTTG